MKKSSHYNLCINDLMMGLLFIFILILVKFMIDYKDKEERILEPITSLHKLMDNIENELTKKNIMVEVDKKNGILKLLNTQYFSEGKYELSEKGRRDFIKIRKIFNMLICYSNLKSKEVKTKWISSQIDKQKSKQILERWIKYCDSPKEKNKYGTIDSILIEGHADRTPIGFNLKIRGIETNLDLAAKRSSNIFKFLLNYNEMTRDSFESGNQLYALSNMQKKPLFGTASYGNLRREEITGSYNEDRHINIRFIMALSEKLKKDYEKNNEK